MGRKSNYENRMYQQLMEIMGRLETVEKDSAQKIEQLNKRIDTLEIENFSLKKENQLLKEDNARLKSIMNNDSSNTSLPPSSDQKGGKPANSYNGRKKTERKAGGQKGHKGTTLTKAEIKDKIASGKCRHEIRTIGKVSGQKYITNLLHDHETALYHFGTEHAECNVHIIRYLRKNTEETGNTWSGEMITLLCEMNRKRKEVMEQGILSFSEERIKAYEESYVSLLQKGKDENRLTTHKYAKQEEKALLKRMEKYSHNHLLFLHDFSVPFDDNISERDLRKAKNRQKMAGGFRKESGNEMYCSIMTIIETLKKRKMGIIENIKLLFTGTPAIF